MEGTVLELAGEMMEEFLDFSFYADVKRVVNQAKVSDHHAILPTEQALKKDWKELPEKKGNLLYLTALQVLKAVSGDFRYEETEVTVSCGGQAFKAKGRKLLQPGYRKTEEIFREKHFPATGHRKEEGGEQSFPDYLKESYTFPGVTAGISEHFTTPPAPYSEDTLLAAMENAGKKEFEKETEKKGLGTPATRAAVIEKLVTSGYVRRNGRQVLPTEAGCELVSILPDHLKSAAMTAQWENKLLAVEKGTVESARFLEEIVGMVREVLEECRNIPVEEQQRFRGKEEVGRCPVCRGPVYEEKWNFCCGNRDCSFALWKDDHYLACMQKKMDRCMASELLNEGKTFVKDFYSTKKKKHFEAALLMEVKDGMVQFRLEFPKKGKKK